MNYDCECMSSPLISKLFGSMVMLERYRDSSSDISFESTVIRSGAPTSNWRGSKCRLKWTIRLCPSTLKKKQYWSLTWSSDCFYTLINLTQWWLHIWTYLWSVNMMTSTVICSYLWLLVQSQTQWTLCSRALLEKLVVAQLAKKISCLEENYKVLYWIRL